MKSNEDAKEGQSGFHLQVTAKADLLPDDLRQKRVKVITFDFHLPYFLEQPSPIQTPIRYGDQTLTLCFSTLTQKITYSDEHVTTERYTKATITLSWESPKTLEQLLSRPLVELTEFPVAVINGLIEAYQLLSDNYFTRQLNPLEILYTSGTITLDGELAPLLIKTEHWADRRFLDREPIDPATWLYFSGGLLSGEPVWIARKTYNQARAARHVDNWHVVFVECVTCIEVFSDYFVSTISKHGNSKKGFQGSLRKILTQVVSKYVDGNELHKYERSVVDWLDKVYSTRNQIVHEARRSVSREEIEAAIHLTGILAQHLENVIKRSLHKDL